jgi:hypothetical protein
MSSTAKAYSEKRNFIRMSINSSLAARLEYNNLIIEGLCRDLSGGGMQVETRTQIAEDTDLVVEVSSGYGHNPSLHARAKVVRCHEDKAHGFLLGLEIVEIL